MKELIKNSLKSLGVDVRRYRGEPDPFEPIKDLTPEQQKILQSVNPYGLPQTGRPLTMVMLEGLAALLNAATYVATSKIPGDIVECGVWRGGSMMIVARTLMSKGDTSRELYLYDTFEGMPVPTSNDTRFDGESAEHLMEMTPKETGIWCSAGLEEVRDNLYSTGYPKEKIHFVKGKVEDTIPAVLPASLALLRLDTDWYESTKHELTHLFPRLNKGGVLIIDDYGQWQGQRKAVDEYFSNNTEKICLHRINYSGRIGVRCGIS